MSFPKNIFVVLGMARSGTSVLMRGMQALGIQLGEHLEKPNSLWNPKGFFEDRDIVFKINRAIFYALNDDWMSLNQLDAQRLTDDPLLTPVRSKALELLYQKIKDTPNWGFKDPRVAKLLAFWQDIFKTLQLQDHYIIALRNPLACALSYQRVTGIEIEVGLLLWIMHMIPAVSETFEKPRIMVSYEALCNNPRSELDRIKNYFNLQLKNPTSINDFVENFLEKKLQHFHPTQDDLNHHSACQVVPLCRKMYELFLQLAQDELSFTSSQFELGWRTIQVEFTNLYPTYQFIDKLLKRNKMSERQLKTIYRSVPWKLSFPLRFIDNILRNLRRRRREEKRLVKIYG